MSEKLKNKFIFLLYSLCLGAIIGSIVWGFMKLVNIFSELIWKVLPNIIKLPFYTIIVCSIGGIIIGIWRKYTGDYPEEMEKVIEKAKKDGKYPYDNMKTMFISAILPLIFGASVGPESGLIGIIVGLCSWLTDKFKKLFKEMKELTQIGMSATIGTIFNSPMFGFAFPLESETEDLAIPKSSKVILYFVAICGALGSSLLLKNIFGGSEGLASLEGLSINKFEIIYFIPISLIGVIAGLIYTLFNSITEKISNILSKYTIIKSIIAGIILGILGTLLPFVMFSGEEQMSIIVENYANLGIIILLLTGITKLFVTNLCISFGLKGGHFFPNIFSGVCLGYAFALIFGINPAYSVCVLTTSLMSYLIRKPVAVILLLMICFPVNAIPIMLVSSVIGCLIKEPQLLKK